MKQEKEEVVVNKIKYTYSVLKDQEHVWSQSVKIFNSDESLFFEGTLLTNKVRVEHIKEKINFINRIKIREIEIKNFSNIDLLEITLYSATGDSYEGCFTEFGDWEFCALKKELDKRLTDIGFLPNENKQ